LRITAKEERVVRKKLQARYVELETRKDGMKFTNRALRSAAEKLQKLSGEYDGRQSALVAQVVGVAATFAEVWQRVGVLLAQLDVLCGFADVAVSAPRPYIRPEMLAQDAGELSLIACRHPCVEAQDGVDFIPNDAIMKRGDSWFQLITGPNMGGKSTFIRQVGACVVLAQIGSFVPCDKAKIAVRDAVFARVGAGDCQMRGVSTFMAEMLETAAILKGATPASLVIIDELGRGTSTWDGMGLAWAISEHLMTEIGASTMFATHFHELTALQGPGGVKNLHVKSAIDPDAGGLTMLYEVKEGSCDQSLGIHVAEFARFPPEVVEVAKKKAAELEAYLPSNTVAGKNNATNCGRKRKGDVNAALRETLVQFANENFEELQGEELRKAAGRWVEELTAVGGNVGVKAKAVEAS
jgi:DNA mismatch repair protein MSH2